MSYKSNYIVGSIPLDKLKPKKVRKNIELTLWERLYIPEIIRGMYITTRHFIINMIGFVFPPKGKKRKIFTVSNARIPLNDNEVTFEVVSNVPLQELSLENNKVKVVLQ